MAAAETEQGGETGAESPSHETNRVPRATKYVPNHWGWPGRGSWREGPRQGWGQRPLTRLSVKLLQILIIGSLLSLHPFLFFIFHLLGLQGGWEGETEGDWGSACRLSAEGSSPASAPYTSIHTQLSPGPWLQLLGHIHILPAPICGGQIKTDSHAKGRPCGGWERLWAIHRAQSHLPRDASALSSLSGTFT